MCCPSHFFFGFLLNEQAVAETDQITLDQRWGELCHIKIALTRAWKADYMSQLNSRSKWTEIHESHRVGTVVIVKDDSLRISD